MKLTEAQETTFTPVQQQQLPNRPRPITPRVKRRAWGDIHVRFWWLSALAVTVVIGWFSIGQIRDALSDREVILNGIPVEATIRKAGERDIVGHSTLREGDTPVVLVGRMPDGTEREFTGTVGPGPGYLKVGETLPIRVHREDPTLWTDRLEVTPWSRELVISLMFLPVIVGLIVVAVWRRRQVLRLWARGVPVEGTVEELRHSAWAPLSRVVRYSLVNSSDRRIFSTLWPASSAPAKGETIQLLAPSDGSTRPTIAARLYQERTA